MEIAILPVDATCMHKTGGFLRRRACGLTAAGQCVYCGEPFCGSHGTRGEEYYEVCERAGCRAKYDDLAHHREWMERHRHDNLAGHCAEDDCEQAPEIACQRCTLRFCHPHLRPRTVQEGDLDRVVTVQLMLCPHCSARRRLWD
ncbi:MAG: hypothetical protein M0R73_06030 [Dehalococcoidia bacterium]|nr:hypothetical protein [Dehalococcoidia bacterium]